MTPAEAGIYISLPQMYEEVKTLTQTVGRIEGADLRTSVNDHETRIRSLERGRWPLPTVGVLGGLAGAVTGAIALFIK
jgi:hypothetical protein